MLEKHMSCISWLRKYRTIRSIRLQVFFKIGPLKIFANFPGKHLSCSCNFIKKRLQHRYFSVNFVKFLRTPFLKNTSGDFCTLGTTVFESKVVRNGKKHKHNMILITILDLHLKQIKIQKDHNIHTYSLFCLVVFAAENSRKPLLLVTYRNQVFLYFHF